MAVNRAVSSHDGRVGLTCACIPDSAIMRSARAAKDTRGKFARWPE